jgi:ABC-type phosphate transport system substrate-binding protein
MPTVNCSSLAATLSLSAVVASIFTFAPASIAQTAVSQDPTIVPAAGNLTAPASYGTISPNAVQYFANGATFQSIALRKLLDFFGIAIPGTVPNIGQIGSQGFQPFNSPRNNFAQINYCGTGSGNGRGTFTGTAAASGSCSYVAFTTTQLISPQAPTPLPAAGSDYGYSAYPAYPTGPSATTTPAPLFAFGTATASVSGLSADDLTNYIANKLPTRSNPIQIPVFFGAVVPALNAGINGGVSPNLTNTQLCQIFDRQITDYSGIGLAAGPINLALRSDSSGNTSVLTGYLANICNSLGVVTPGFTTYYITAAINLFPTAATIPVGSSTGINPVATGTPGVVRRPGDDGVGDYIATTSGGFGYVESSFALPFAGNAPITPNTPAPIQAALQNSVSGSFLTAGLVQVRNALSSISLRPNSTYTCVLTVAGLPVVPTNGAAYPIVGQNYLFAYTNYPTQAQSDAVRGIFNFVLANRTTPISSNDQIAQAEGFILLGSGTANSTINPLRAQARACINSIRVSN